MEHRNRYHHWPFVVSAALTTCLAVSVAAPGLCESPGGVPEATGVGRSMEDAPRAEGAAGAGMRVYIDPSTGGVVPPPAGAPIAEPALQRSTSAVGLVEVPSPVDGGGVMVDLKGRFQSVMTVTRKPDGSLTTDCTIGGGPVSAR